MDVDDDMFVVIVGDETEDSQVSEAVLKQESLGTDNTSVDDLIETAARHGQYIYVKLEPQENIECEVLEDETFIETSKNFIAESNDITKAPGDSDVNDTSDDYDSSQDYDLECEPVKQKSNTRNWPSVSFVEKLRNDYPDLRRHQKLLISTLTEIMRNLKPPPTPDNYYYEASNFLKCVYCNANSDTVPAAGRHYQEKHGERYLICFACGVDFRSKTNLYKHEKSCKAPDAVIVLKARAGYLGRKGRSRPFLTLQKFNPKPRSMNESGKSARFPCPLCSGAFFTKSTLAAHLNLHRGERPFQCHVCPCAYTSSSALTRHTKKHENTKFICDHCGSLFKAKSTLVAHMDTHKPQRKFACAECPRRFAQRAGMLLHVRRDHRHLPPPCACQICPKRFPRMSLLKKHMNKQHGMILITQKMFLKALPSMSALEVERAKIVLKSDVTGMDQDVPAPTPERVEEVEDGSCTDAPQDTDDTVFQDFMQYVEGNDSDSDSKTKVFIIQNGQVINLNKTDVENIQQDLCDVESVFVDTDTVLDDVNSDQATEDEEENNVDR